MLNVFKIILIPAILCFCFAIIRGQGYQHMPRNEVSKDPTLERFVADLKAAIDKKDEKFILAVLDKEFSAMIDGEGGIEEFGKVWEPEKDSSLLWPTLKRVIDLGGVFLNDPNDETGKYQFVFPYVYDLPLKIEDDPYTIGVITGKNVNLREKPDTKSAVKTQLTYDVIEFLYDDKHGETVSGTNELGEPEWYLIETPDHSKRGWVNWRYVYSPMNYRLFLYKNDKGSWKISAFIAGD